MLYELPLAHGLLMASTIAYCALIVFSVPAYSDPTGFPLLTSIGVCLKLWFVTLMLPVSVKFGNPMETVCMSISSPLFVPVTEIVKLWPSVTLNGRLTSVTTGAALRGARDA